MARKKILTGILIFLILPLSFFSCRDEELGTPLKLDKVNLSIFEYLKENPTSFSILTEALEKTRLSETINLYGSVTLFAPSNDAFTKFMKNRGISKITDLHPDSLALLLKYHIYNTKFKSSDFQNGSLPASTVSGDLIKMDISSGLKNTILNNSVGIDEFDISATNGYIHTIREVLQPPRKTIFEYVKSNPDYSIFAEAIQKTGLDTALLNKILYEKAVAGQSIVQKKLITFFAESNEVYKKNGINSFDDLAKKYSNTYNTTKKYTSLTDSLNIFVRYHCIPNRYLYSDFRDDFYETSRPDSWLIFDTKSGLNINRHTEKKLVLNPVSGKYELKDIEVLIRVLSDKCDNILSNGILHQIDNVLKVYQLDPVIVKAYFGGAPEDRVITLLNGDRSTLRDQFVQMNNNPSAQSVVGWLKWGYQSGAFSIIDVVPPVAAYPISVNPIYMDDHPVEVMDGLRVANAIGLWMEITTKPVIKGKYTLYIYEQHNVVSNQNWKFTWSLDGVQGTDMGDFNYLFDNFNNDPRIYNEKNDNIPGTTLNNSRLWGSYKCMQKRKLGIFTFSETVPHKVKIQMVDESRSPGLFKIQFEPVK